MASFRHPPARTLARWHNNTQQATVFIAALLLTLGVAGSLLLTLSRAATPPSSLETETGTASSAAGIISDTGASNGSAIKFGAGGSGGNQAVTNGQQITLANTGYLAYTGPQGQTCTDATMTVYTGAVNASTLGSSATCLWLKGGINIDAPITLNACKFTAPVVNTSNYHITLNYCTVNPSTPGDWSLGYRNFSATRSQLIGSSDGVRFGGSTNDVLIENYIRTKSQSSEDHNDGVQMYGATGGGTLLRNNIDCRPADGGNGANGAIFIADAATGTYEIRDNYLVGGAYTLRLQDSGYYRVTGNIIEKNSYAYGPFTSTASISGAFLEWNNNKLSDGTTISLN